jgi:para-aminobenzoate synthetase
MKTLLVDNYDSYTYNLHQLIARVNGVEPLVVRNDELCWDEFLALHVDNVVISPGPGRPENARDFGICGRILRDADVPVLGVCLGHQGLATAFGGEVVGAPRVMHGRIDAVYHDGRDLFAGVPQGFDAVRYHSLVVAPDLPACLERAAWTADGVVMGLRHRERPLWGVQFHPESICTEHGERLLQNFRALTLRWHARHRRTRIADEGASWTRRTAVASSDVATPPDVSHAPASYAARVRRLPRWFDAEQVFVELYGDAHDAFWLDGNHAEVGLSRFSYMGACDGPLGRVVRYTVDGQELTVRADGATTTHHEGIFGYLRREIARLRCAMPRDVPFDFRGGFVGYWGYELKAECDGDAAYQSHYPDAVCMFPERMIVFDHQERVVYLLHVGEHQDAEAAERWFDATEQQLQVLPALPPLEVALEDAADLPVQIHQPHNPYLDAIAEAQEALRAGESYEICLTTQIDADVSVDPLLLYRHLRRVNPAPYAAFLHCGDLAVLSSSPERFLRIDRERRVETKPIKGTARRGATVEADRAARTALQRDPKVRAENLMIVDLLRNDLSRVCEVGSVEVPKLMDIETYATVHQMVSTVRGTLRADADALACLQATFPGGSMTGAPKLRTMEIIDRLEGEARGIYAGALGWMGLDGTADLSIVIRTMVWTPDRVTLGAGGAITVDSDPEAEWEEMLLKAQALLDALGTAATVGQQDMAAGA